MTRDREAIVAGVRSVLLSGALEGEDPDALEETTALITSGVLDSVRTAQLVADLEDHFDVAFEAYEMSVEFLDTVALISDTIRGKLDGSCDA